MSKTSVIVVINLNSKKYRAGQNIIRFNSKFGYRGIIDKFQRKNLTEGSTLSWLNK